MMLGVSICRLYHCKYFKNMFPATAPVNVKLCQKATSVQGFKHNNKTHYYTCDIDMYCGWDVT